ncbi:MAG TPA: hypothetical protein VGQ99_01060 [Tepidisphaeraceae bacterium]|jgi:hypothetical protein|nr:hypothetical protein [Tepidisphaeraceae bacterium]
MMASVAELVGKELEQKLEHHLHRLLTVVEAGGARGLRLVEEGKRLCKRVHQFVNMRLVENSVDEVGLELACFALQLPSRNNNKLLPPGKMGQVSLKDRCEQSAELLISTASDHVDSELLEQATTILREMPHRSTKMDEAKLLADSVNLDDFGITGLIMQAMQLSRQNAGVEQVADGFQKRRDYGYWEARLKDGFHYEPVRKLARERLKRATQMVDLLLDELREDQAL